MKSLANLKKTAIWITLLALFLKLSGFLRESIVAKVFGVSDNTDGFYLAFAFITLVVAMISGGFNNVFLPLYVKHRKDEPERTEKDANGILNSTVLLFLGITLVGFFLVPYIVPFIYGDMNSTTKQVAVSVTQIFVVFISIIALNGVLDSYLQARRIFVPAQISKVFATLMAAVFALLFAETWGIRSVAYGFVVGTIIGTILQFFYLIRSGYKWTPTIKVDKVFRTAFLALIVPSLLNALVGQLNMFIDKTFASGIGNGAVTYLNNASLIVSIPNAIYATTIAAIIFTMLSDQIDQKKKFQGTFFMGMEISFLTLLPIAAGLLIVGDLAISFIYERGKFTPADTHHTYMALILYLPMIVAQGLQFIVSKSMYARGRTSTIFKISVTTILLNIILNYVFVRLFSYPGLALSSSLVAIYYLVVSAIVVYRDFDKSESLRLFTLVWRGIPPVIIMIVPLYFLRQVPFIHHLYSLWQLAILIPLGVVLYVVSLRVIYREGFNRLLGLVKKRAKKA